MKRFYFFLLMSFAYISNLHAANMDHAMYLYESGEFEKAHQQFVELADLGNSDAIFNIGVMYARGEFLELDKAFASAWIRLAIKHGHEGVKVEKLISSKLSNEEKKRSDKIFENINSEFGPSAIETKYLLTVDKVSSKNFKASRVKSRSLPRYPKSSIRDGKSGYVDIEFTIAPDGTTRHHTVLLASGQRFENEALKAVRRNTYFPATLNGKPVYEFGKSMRIMFRFTDKKIEQEELDRSLKKIKRKTNGGTGHDKYLYGYSLSLLRSVAGDLADTLESPTKWFVKAAQGGNPFGKYELGKNMMYGNHCDVDDLKARIWLERAAADGLTDAQIILGTEYLRGGRYVKDSALGYSWLQKAAEGDSKTAQLYLAWRLATESDPSVRDPKKASTYLTMSDDRSYHDKLSLYETKAAVDAALGNFKKAEKWQSKVIKEANKLDLPTDVYQERLATIMQQKDIVLF